MRGLKQLKMKSPEKIDLNETDDSLLRTLMDDTVNYHDILACHGIKVSFAEFYDAIHALVYYSKRGYYHITINSLLTFPFQRRAFIHEIKHIIDDIPKCTYTVCFDEDTDDVYRMEVEADRFMEEVAALYEINEDNLKRNCGE